jgi:hypothetical protein
MHMDRVQALHKELLCREQLLAQVHHSRHAAKASAHAKTGNVCIPVQLRVPNI